MADPTTDPKPEPLGTRIPLSDLRGVLAISLLSLTAMLFVMIFVKPELTSNQGFMFLAQAVITSGLIGGAVAYMFTASAKTPVAPSALTSPAGGFSASIDVASPTPTSPSDQDPPK